MNFIEKYNMLKDQGKTEHEIAKELYCTKSTLWRWKKEAGVKLRKRNQTGFTEAQLVKGESIGLTRHLMYQRVNMNGWSIVDAYSVPKNVTRKKWYAMSKIYDIASLYPSVMKGDKQ